MRDEPNWLKRDWTTHWSAVKARLETVEDTLFTEIFASASDSNVSFEKGPLRGACVSIKANFDVAGYHSSAGTVLLGKQPATQDAVAVQRLKEAGAYLIGHTNMTELAYSGVGLNPHYGTPANPLVPDAIPGGSTSGGAVSVANGLADIALGTDTGGSLRIPAAFCGLVGFKPSQQSIPSDGCWPLSQTLDSIGPIADSVNTCRIAWQVLSGHTEAELNQTASVRWVIPTNFGFDACDDAVLRHFEQAVSRLERAGYKIERESLDVFDAYKALPVWQFSAVESRRYYADKLDLDSSLLDPRVRQRIARGQPVTDAEFHDTLAQRATLMARLQQAYPDVVFLLPTVACLPPKFKAFDSDEAFDRINLLCLRNTTFANVIDGSSLSLPIGTDSEPVGLLLTMQQGEDQRLLAVAKNVEAILVD